MLESSVTVTRRVSSIASVPGLLLAASVMTPNDTTTKVIARGAGHKTADAKQAGKPLAVTDLVKEGQ